jgi:hypothetical protein
MATAGLRANREGISELNPGSGPRLPGIKVKGSEWQVSGSIAAGTPRRMSGHSRSTAPACSNWPGVVAIGLVRQPRTLGGRSHRKRLAGALLGNSH